MAALLLQTREAQELLVRQIKRTCRGEMVFADEGLRNKFRDRYESLQLVQNTAELKLLVREMEEVGKFNCPGEFDTWAQASASVFQFLFSFRDNCGADFNDTICAGPFDGREYTYTCRCGQRGHYVAPHFT